MKAAFTGGKGSSITNFQATLPSPQSDLAQQLLKDPYNFDFLTLTKEAQERDLERGVTAPTYASSSSNWEQDSRLWEARYRWTWEARTSNSIYSSITLKLRCFVVIELKMGAFKPEYAGKMNFYLAAVDDLLRHADDKPSIGLILCKAKNRIIAEYALRNTKTPMGVSEFRQLEKLPEQLKGTLPSIEEIEAELARQEKPS